MIVDALTTHVCDASCTDINQASEEHTSTKLVDSVGEPNNVFPVIADYIQQDSIIIEWHHWEHYVRCIYMVAESPLAKPLQIQVGDNQPLE
jgi:hypothetical protein